MKQNKTGVIMIFACLGLVFVGAGGVLAQENTGTNDAPKTEAAVKRDPFWPVGYTPERLQKKEPEQEKKVEAGGWKEAMKKVVINGVSSSAENEYYAVVNGQLKSVGDTVSVRLNNVVYTWAIDDIQGTGSVKLRRVSAQ
ncbi:MAG: hypothetical protein JXR25_10515 [Pontiellaceae bacterium]|nr:hypothetical protein [Pontiellaceae bacterium]MBN2785252.1 hypothetical protein [Pontiellaceae bacterium]